MRLVACTSVGARLHSARLRASLHRDAAGAERPVERKALRARVEWKYSGRDGPYTRSRKEGSRSAPSALCGERAIQAWLGAYVGHPTYLR